MTAAQQKFHTIDPYIPEIKFNGGKLKSMELSAEMLASFDVAVITTNHSKYDADFIVKHSRSVVDTRNLTKSVKDVDNKITKLGSGTRF